MNGRQAKVTRNTIACGCLFLATGLALSVVQVVAAQSQLPGTRLTHGSGNDLRPAWSPDGSHIAFFSNESGNNDIWVIDADGSNQRQLTNDPADDRRPAWNPDGAWIAFDSDRAGSRDIWVMEADGQRPRQLTNSAGQDSFAAWSPDGNTIAYYSFEGGVLDMWSVDVKDFLQGGAAGQPRRLTSELADEHRNECTFACHVPAWSPDGTRIAYQAKNHTQIWIVGVDGSNPVAITDGKTRVQFPWWTPDGKLLYLVEHTDSNQEPVNDVWVMDADGQNPVLLFPNIPHGGPLYWSPDGSMKIAFHSPRSGNFDIYTIVLGQEASTPQPMAVPPTAGAVVVGPATPLPASATASPTAAPTAAESTNLGGPASWGALAVIALGGVVLVVYLARKGRSS